jgi:hypothetical protein
MTPLIFITCTSLHLYHQRQRHRRRWGPLPSELIEMLPAVPPSAMREEGEDQVSVAAYWSNKKNLPNDDKQRDKPKNTYALISYNLIRI